MHLNDSNIQSLASQSDKANDQFLTNRLEGF